VTPTYFSPDVAEFLRILASHRVRYLVVGGEAVIHYGYARLTGDIDVYYESAPENAERLFASLRDFWSGSIPGIVDAGELIIPGTIIQFGVPPNRIDLLNQIDGVSFDECWRNRTETNVPAPGGDVQVIFIGLTELIKNKETSDREKDRDDLRFLRRASRREGPQS
jgi:hypothetical protein